MKKFLMTAFLYMLAATSLISCGNKEVEKQVLKVAGIKGAYGDVYWTELKKGFEKAYPNVEVELTVEKQVEKTIYPQIMSGLGPDVIYVATNRPEQLTEMMISSHAVRDLSDVLEMNVYNETVKLKDRILPSIMGNGITNPYVGDPTHYMLPLFFSSNGLFFNADKFYQNNGNGKLDEKKSGKYELPTTWDEFFALGKELNKERVSDPSTPYLFTYPTAGYLDTMIPASIASSAGEVVVKQAFNYEPIWEDKNVRKVFENLSSLKPYLLPTTVGNANDTDFKENQMAVIDGRALFMTNGNWVKGEMEGRTPKGFKWGTTPFLAFEKDGQRYGTVNAEQIYISANTQVPKLAEKFLLYVYSKEGLEIIAKYANDAFVPAYGYDELAVSNGINPGAVAGYYDGSAKVLIGGFTAATAEGVDWNKTLCETMNSVMSGKKTVNQWIKQLVTDSAKLRASL